MYAIERTFNCVLCVLKMFPVFHFHIVFSDCEILLTRNIANRLDVSGFEKRGHFGPDLNCEILICSETIGNRLSFTVCFMFIAALIHFLCSCI